MLCPRAGLPLGQGTANAQPAHVLAGTLAVLFTAACAAGSIPAGLLCRQSLPSTKRDIPPSHQLPASGSGQTNCLTLRKCPEQSNSPYFEAEHLRLQAEADSRPRRSVIPVCLPACH